MTLSPEWLEIAKLVVSAFTPIAVIFVGFRLERARTQNQELVKVKLRLYYELAYSINDILVFYTGVGHWAELNPKMIIDRKRSIDRLMHTNKHLFTSSTFNTYKKFEDAFFTLYSGANQPAKLKLDQERLSHQLGPGFLQEWKLWTSKTNGSSEQQIEQYDAFMLALSQEITGKR